MEKEYRAGVDTRVALVANMRRALAEAALPSPAPKSSMTPPAMPPPASAGFVPGASNLPRWLSPLKPVFRPVLSRIRRYFAATLHDEMMLLRDALQDHRVAAQQRYEQMLAELTQAASRHSQFLKATNERLQAQYSQLESQYSALLRRLDVLEQYGYAAAHSVVLPCGPDTVMLKAEAGYVLCSTSDEAQLAYIAETGDPERGTRILIERLLEPGSLFVDVGANVGLHTLAAARAMKGRGSIIAFEPFPATFDLMRRSVAVNGYSRLVEGHASAAFNMTGRGQLHLGTTSGHHSLFPLSQTAAPPVDVPLETLDEVLASRGPVDLIKIDVEGAELEVLDGARDVLQRSPGVALIVEYGPSHLRRVGRSPADWFAFFDRLGFVDRAIHDSSGALEKRTRAQLDAAQSTNLLFARPQSRAWRRAESTA